jgi:hypothetical protein
MMGGGWVEGWAAGGMWAEMQAEIIDGDGDIDGD